MVRRVVGGNRVERAVRKALDAGQPVALLAQRRIDAAVAVIADDPVVRRADVVRRGLGGHAHAARLRLAHQLHAALRGDVAQVDALVLSLGHQDVARDHHFLRRAGDARQAELGGDEALVHHAVAHEALVLAVAHDEHAEVIGVLHRQAKQVGIGDRPAVVGDRDDAGLLHAADLRHLLALQALRDRTDRVDVHAAALGLRLLQDVACHRRAVVDRMGVGHAAHAREAAARRGAGAGDDVLLVLLARIAQMAVHIDEARRDDLARCVHHLHALGAQVFADAGDFSIPDQNIHNRVNAVLRIDHAAAANENRIVHPYASLRVSMYSSAMRTATPLSTCWLMTDWLLSAALDAISTPRFIGPGCITSACFFASATR